MLTSVWVILWICLCLILFVSLLEAVIRRIKMSHMARAETELRARIRLVGADQIHIFTLQPVSSELHTNRGIVIQQSPQQQQQMLQQQEIDASNDPPPKYEDVMRNASVSIPMPSNKSIGHQSNRY